MEEWAQLRGKKRSPKQHQEVVVHTQQQTQARHTESIQIGESVRLNESFKRSARLFFDDPSALSLLSVLRAPLAQYLVVASGKI
jgi:hypothetical protein